MSDHGNTPELMEAFFDKRATGYEAHMAKHPESEYWRILLEKQLPETTAATQVLDLGCGTGLELQHIIRRQPNARVTCIDVSEGMLVQLRRTHASLLRQLVIIKGSYLSRRWPEQHYDHAIACVTMHHWLFPTKLSIYKGVNAALRTNATFIVSDYFVHQDEEDSLAKAYRNLMESGKISGDLSYHIDIPFSVTREMQLLKEAGFSEVRLIEEYYSKGFNAGMIVARK